MTISKLTIRLAIFASLMLIGLAPAISVADVIPMERQEVIQRSGLIFSGEVLAKESRRNAKGSMIVTDYTIRVDEILSGQHSEQTIKLTFAGGVFEGEGQSMSDVPTLSKGEVVLLMLEESDHPLFSPVTGVFQGKYSAMTVAGRNTPVVVDSHLHPILDKDGNEIGFGDFVDSLKSEIPVARSKPLPDRTVPEALQHLVIQDLPSIPYEQNPTGMLAKSSPIRVPLSKDEIAEEPGELDQDRVYVDDQRDRELRGQARWSYSNRSENTPITFNPWPDTFGSFNSHDQFAMSYWNDYADIYRVMEPTGTWAWENDRYDMAGFESNATMIDQFGSGWGATTLAVCWSRWNSSSGFRLEADIAFNPAYSWSIDDYATYSNNSLYCVDRTLTHEIGHAWGLDHQHDVDRLSVMQYCQKKYRAYNDLFRDDIQGVKAAYPATVQALDDLGIALYYSCGGNTYCDSDTSTEEVTEGDTINVSNFVIENMGTTVIDEPNIDWYLVPTINSWTGSRYVGSTTHATLNVGSWFLTARTLTIPSGIPDGTYYLGAFVRNAEDDQGDNNSTWLDREIVVFSRPSNDNWINAVSVGAGFPSTRFGNNDNATEETGEGDLANAGATVWWWAQADVTGTMIVDTFGSDFDTRLHIYEGPNFASLDLITENDDADGGRQSYVEFPCVAGQFYEIRVSGYNGAEGAIVLHTDTEEAEVVSVSPTNVQVTAGNFNSGNIVSLRNNDQSDYSIFRSPQSVASRTEFVVTATSQTADPIMFDVTLDGSVFSRREVAQRIALFNYDTSSYETVSTAAAARFSDATVNASATGNLSRFVGPGNQIRARVRFDGESARLTFTSNTDQFFWTIQ